MDAAGRLLGASDGDLGYFYNAARSEVYLFDTVEGGNGYAETLRRFFHVPPLERLVNSRGARRSTLPDVDGFQLLDETLGDCPAQQATRVTFDSVRSGVVDPSRLAFPATIAKELEARVRHEYSPITGSSSLLSHLAQTQPALFATWSDLLWLQVVPERYAEELVTAGVITGIEDLRSRMQLCVAGCLECVDNVDQSVHGSLGSREHVSRTLLDALRAAAVRAEEASYVAIPAGTSVPATLQAHAGEPVLGASGQPVTVDIDDNGTTRQILLSKVLATVSPALGLQPGMITVRKSAPGSGVVLLPFLAAYRDEKPRA
jgi:hypothetical protein